MKLIPNIKKFKKSNKVLFTTPSHAQGEVVAPLAKRLLGKKIFDYDYSEVHGLDNLQNPQGLLAETQQHLANAYNAQNTFILTNGATSGILALMLTTLKENDRVLITRNCHKSIYNGLVLTGAMPVWYNIEYDEKWDIAKPIDILAFETFLMQNPNIKTAIITTPTYEGAMFNLAKIAEICNEKEITLIIDESHGALYNFDQSIGTPALKCGIDACVQSLHKTAGALNPSALLHLGHESKINPEELQKNLNLISTTSPSYPLMINIEATVDFLSSNSGQKHIQKLLLDIENLKRELSEYSNIHIYSNNNDITKILVKIDNLSGFELSSVLYNDFNIEDELSNENAVLLLTGVGTKTHKFNKLKKALIKIAKKMKDTEPREFEHTPRIIPRVKYTPRQAYYAKYKEVPLEQAIGKVSCEMILPYPPGIPVLIPGEIIQKEHFMYLDESKTTIKIIG